MKLASIIRTFDRPRRRRRQMASSSFDSGAATSQLVGGCSQRSQSLQKCRVDSRCTPWETSTERRTQSWQSAPAAVVPSIGAPQLQQRILDRLVFENHIYRSSRKKPLRDKRKKEKEKENSRCRDSLLLLHRHHRDGSIQIQIHRHLDEIPIGNTRKSRESVRG